MIKNCIIILNYNDYRSTINLIKSVVTNKYIRAVVVVDNCSTDESYEEIAKYKNLFDFDLIKTKQNKGYAAGNNVGIRYAIKKYNPDIVTVANPDVIFDEAYLKTVNDFYMKNDHVGIVAGMMNSKSNINNPLIAWKLPQFSDLILSNFILLKRIVGNRQEYKGIRNEKSIKPVDVLPGSLFTISVDSFNSVNGFCEETFLYEEENIISYKLKKKGYINYYIPYISYIHNHAVSINKSIPNVSKRLDIDYDSRKVYAKRCLKINKFKIAILTITYWIGKFNYLICLKILNIKR